MITKKKKRFDYELKHFASIFLESTHIEILAAKSTLKNQNLSPNKQSNELNRDFSSGGKEITKS